MACYQGGGWQLLQLTQEHVAAGCKIHCMMELVTINLLGAKPKSEEGLKVLATSSVFNLLLPVIAKALAIGRK